MHLLIVHVLLMCSVMTLLYFVDCLFKLLPMQHYSAQMQYSKAIQSQSEPFMEKEKMTAKFRGVVMLKQFEVKFYRMCLFISMCVCMHMLHV